jgi:hypothetical protein
MSNTAHLTGLLARTRELFDRGSILMDCDSDGHNVQVVADLPEAAWRTVRAFILVEDGQPADLRRELGDLSPKLSAGMVAAWVKNFWERTNVTDPEDLSTLAETVVYLVETLREDPTLEYEDYDRMALSIDLEEAAQA